MIDNPFNKVRFIDVVGPMHKYTGWVTLGTLSYIDAMYRFTYNRSPNVEIHNCLPGLNQVVNEAKNLREWPTFSIRIPPLQREDVRKVIVEQGIDETKPMALLATLGAHVVQNPYILVAKL